MKLGSNALLGSIVAGAVAGVIAGTILAVSSWTLQKAQDRAERQDQIRTLAALISDYEYQILIINEGSRFQLGDNVVEATRDELRKAKYDYLKKRVDSLLDGRGSQISYDEKQDVRRAFGLSDLYPRAILSDGNYREMFAQLETLEWLDLEYRDR